jgi:predicted dehydrogenase
VTLSKPLIGQADPIRVILVGAGLMGRNWLRVLTASPDVEVVGLVDLDVDLARRVLKEADLEQVVAGPSVMDLAGVTGAQAVIDVTVPVAHHAINTEALFGGLPVLCEKPIAPTVSQALSLAAAAEASGQLLMTSQSRRYYDNLTLFRQQVRSIGEVGIATTEFFKGPHFGGFRDEMAHPLLVDMAIHAFDTARYLLDADPVSVYCETFNPSWSWYDGDAATTAMFELTGGIRYIYNGSWCSSGLESSWNGAWRVSGSNGSATWDGDNAPNVQLVELPEGAQHDEDHTHAGRGGGGGEEIAGSLAEFVDALRTGRVPSGEVHSNVLSLAMVEAAVLSAESGQRVFIDRVLEDAYSEAVVTEEHPQVLVALTAWGSAKAGISR